MPTASARSLTEEHLLDSVAALRDAERFVRGLQDADLIDLDDEGGAGSGAQALILHVQPELVRVRDGLRRLRESLAADPAAEVADELERRVAALIELVGCISMERPSGDRPDRP